MVELDVTGSEGIPHSGIAEFERNLLSERVKSGLAAAKARGKKLGRQTGQRPKGDRVAPKVLALVAEGRSYRWIARDMAISKISPQSCFLQPLASCSLRRQDPICFSLRHAA